MRNQIGITQWTVPWGRDELCPLAEKAGLSLLHLDLGSAADGYPMMKPENREAWRESCTCYRMNIVSLALNDLCTHGFAAGLDSPASETAVTTMRYGVETAREMGIPFVSVPHFFANEISDEMSFHATAEALRMLCDLAGDNGIMIHTENVLDNENLTRLWNEVNRDNLRLLFDSQNYSAMTRVDAAEIFLKWQDYCGPYIHIKDGDAPLLGSRNLWQGNSNF